MKAFSLIILVATMLAVGCGPLRSRLLAPHAVVDNATLDGYEHARFWGDEPSERLTQTFVESWDQERATLGFADNFRQFPDAHYLALSGGGQDGAFGAGVLCGWSASGTRPTFKVVTGISTGALIAPFAFLGASEDANLKRLYTTIEERDLIQFNGLLALLRSDAAYNTAPLSKVAENCYTEDFIDRVAAEHRKGRRLFVGTTHLDAGRPMVWDMGQIACSDRNDRVEMFRKILLASAAIPGAFPPVYLEVKTPDGKTFDEMHVDGGVTREMFLLPSELRLYEIRDEHGVERQSHLHIIRNSRYRLEHAEVEPRVGPIAMRSIDTLIKAQAVGDLMTLYYEAKENHMTFSLTSIPDDVKGDYKSLFDKKYMNNLFEIGYRLGLSGKAWRSKPNYATAGKTTQPSTGPVAIE